MKVIPAIDLRQGKCVRLYQGRFDRQTNYDRDPVALACHYQSLGFEVLHLVDLDGAESGQQFNQAIVREIVAATDMTVQLGGGVRRLEDVHSWLNAGVSRVVIGSLAVTAMDTVCEWLQSIGAEKIVLALDVSVDDDNIPLLATHGWTRATKTSLWDCLDSYSNAGLRHVLCTDISRDGALTGPNVALYASVIERYPPLRLQASGGVRNTDDLLSLRRLGAAGAITGRALLDGAISEEEIRSFLRVA
jgi:phosphoribosylformimino-5-aminoimidazole carboxamide ribotide isomerase